MLTVFDLVDLNTKLETCNGLVNITIRTEVEEAVKIALEYMRSKDIDPEEEAHCFVPAVNQQMLLEAIMTVQLGQTIHNFEEQTAIWAAIKMKKDGKNISRKKMPNGDFSLTRIL